jgi:Amt family ammonium transporter
LRQILVNLLGNAIKFTEIGSIRVVMQLVQEAGEETKLQFEVTDTGIGISEEQAALLFQPFSQVDASARRRFGGSGLGLAISKRLAGLLGGDVTLRSVLGEGSTFRVTISTSSPNEWLAPGHLSDAAEACLATANVQRHLDCRILLAEDSPDSQRLIAFLLRKVGAEVALAENGKIAVDLAMAAQQKGKPFDVVLMDMQMPVMDGYEATGLLRSAGYVKPIIALTAHAMTDDRQKCLDAGCDDYVAKPIDRSRLFEAVAKYAAPSVQQPLSGDCPTRASTAATD